MCFSVEVLRVTGEPMARLHRTTNLDTLCGERLGKDIACKLSRVLHGDAKVLGLAALRNGAEGAENVLVYFAVQPKMRWRACRGGDNFIPEQQGIAWQCQIPCSQGGIASIRAGGNGKGAGIVVYRECGGGRSIVPHQVVLSPT